MLQVRGVHPDAGMPDHRNMARRLDTFVIRLLADGSAKNEVRARYGARLEAPKLRGVRSEDLWEFSMARPKKVAAGRNWRIPATTYFETTVTVLSDKAVLAHLPKGATYSSTAFEG